MQIPTNTGPITLAPSDIENGMVFRDPTDNDANTFRADPALYTDGIAGMQEVAEALAADVAAGKVHFLGCDPRLTSRAGCERFGVSSTVDAAAHGFARLRDGGAVDLRVRGNVPKGTIISHEYGSRVDFDELLGAKGGRSWRERSLRRPQRGPRSPRGRAAHVLRRDRQWLRLRLSGS